MRVSFSLVAALTALAGVPAPALAQAYQCSLPGRIDPVRPPRPDGPVRKVAVARYVLAASWSPEFCKSARDKASMQCSGNNGRFGFVLHGLWPEAKSGPDPQWCVDRSAPQARDDPPQPVHDPGAVAART